MQTLVTLSAEIERLSAKVEALITGDATFDIITCKTWNVVDKNEQVRISAFTLDDGSASVLWLDKDGKIRISAGTTADGAVVLPTTDQEKP